MRRRQGEKGKRMWMCRRERDRERQEREHLSVCKREIRSG